MGRAVKCVAAIVAMLVLGAWTVLSNPSKKTQFDIELKIFESRAKTQRREDSGGKMEGQGGETFWTVCPYCYYVYEYPRVYEECCLRCQNQNCRRGFHAAEIPRPPPAAVVSNGQYWCLGFYPWIVHLPNRLNSLRF